jgi:ABC-type cobalamin/Fe3+-siderophores transport system ATPase subunit
MAVEEAHAATGLQLRDLTLSRDGRVVLRGCTMAAPRGQVTVVVAPSGAGKSTLLRCCNRLLEPDAGTVLLDGAPIAAQPACELRRRVGLVAQTPLMLPGTVRDNLAYGLEAPARGGKRGRAGEGAVDERGPAGERALTAALAAAGLDEAFLPRAAEELSGGERARVALARALTRGPELLLLDEPTAALDAVAAGHVAETVRRLAHERGLGILVATHDLPFAAAVADRAVALREGRAVEGVPADVFAAAERAGAGGAAGAAGAGGAAGAEGAGGAAGAEGAGGADAAGGAAGAEGAAGAGGAGGARNAGGVA